MLNEELLINNKEERDKYIDRINVLEQVKNIITIPKLELSTRGQVANYYNVTEGAIRQIEIRHKDEIESDGFRLYKRSEIEKIIYISADTAESIAKDLLASDVNTIFSVHYAIEEFFYTE